MEAVMRTHKVLEDFLIGAHVEATKHLIRREELVAQSDPQHLEHAQKLHRVMMHVKKTLHSLGGEVYCALELPLQPGELRNRRRIPER